MAVTLKEMNGACTDCATHKVSPEKLFVESHPLSSGGRSPTIDVSSMIKRMPVAQPVSA